jgi:hypothetical protein
LIHCRAIGDVLITFFDKSIVDRMWVVVVELFFDPQQLHTGKRVIQKLE